MLQACRKFYELMESRTECRTDVLVPVKWVHDRRDSTPDKKPAIWPLQTLINNMEKSYFVKNDYWLFRGM